MIPMYNTKKFTDFWQSAEDFLNDYKNCKLPATITDTNCTTLFYLLYARYGNSPVANYDETQFKYKVWSTIYQYGAEWQKKLDIQDKLRELSEEDLLRSSESILNMAQNPSVAPGTLTTEELQYVNAQNAQKFKRSKLDAYTFLWTALDSDITSEFLNKFAKLFKMFVMPDHERKYFDDCCDDDCCGGDCCEL